VHVQLKLPISVVLSALGHGLLAATYVLGPIPAKADTARAGRLLPWESARVECLLNRVSLLDSSENEAAPGCSSQNERRRRRTEDFQAEFRDALCTRPQSACEVLIDPLAAASVGNRKNPQSPRVSIGSIPFDSSCRAHPIWIREQLDDRATSLGIVEILRERTGTEHAGRAVFQTEEWARAQEIFRHAKEALLETLGPKGLRAPPAVLARIRAATIFDPNDPKLNEAQVNESMSSCGLSFASDSTDASADTSSHLGHWNAFAANPATVVLCPKMVLGLQSPEAMGALLLHELAHLAGPCLLGFELADEREGPNCEMPSTPNARRDDIIQWRGVTARMERCFHQSGLNDGHFPGWIEELARDMDSAASDDASESSSGAPADVAEAATCGMRKQDFIPSEDPHQGLASACARDGFFLGATFHYGIEAYSEEATRRERARARRISNRVLRRSVRPNANQFNEAFSDAMVSRAMPGFLARYSDGRKNPGEQGVDIAWGFSFLCDPDQSSHSRRDQHPRGDRRMEILISDPVTREAMGCSPEKRLRSRVAQNLDGCLEDGAGASPTSGASRPR
jgi:hypothetical protein